MVRGNRAFDTALPAGEGTAPRAARPLGDPRFRALLGAAQWDSLLPAIRRRFSTRLADAQTRIYTGEITQASMTGAGRLLAQVVRLIGGPLPLTRDIGAPAIVTVTEDAAGGGQFWTRIYGRRCGFPQVIHSSKRFAGPTGLEEYLGRGIGMALTVDGAGGALYFRSDHYFLQIFGRRLRLPGWLSPGMTTVGHIDRGGGRFAFTLELRHPLLGVLISQTALFHDIERVAIDRLHDQSRESALNIKARTDSPGWRIAGGDSDQPGSDLDPGGSDS